MFTARFNAEPFRKLRDEVDQLWRDVSRSASAGLGLTPFPPLNMWEKDDTLFVEAELPGLNQENLELEILGGELVIKGQRPDVKAEGESYHRQERGTGNFERRVRLPFDVDAERVQAKLDRGVLQVQLPKAEGARPRKISVNAS